MVIVNQLFGLPVAYRCLNIIWHYENCFVLVKKKPSHENTERSAIRPTLIIIISIGVLLIVIKNCFQKVACNVVNVEILYHLTRQQVLVKV